MVDEVGVRVGEFVTVGTDDTVGKVLGATDMVGLSVGVCDGM